MISSAEFSDKIYDYYLRGRTGVLSHGKNYFDIASDLADEAPEKRETLVQILCPRYKTTLYEYGQRAAQNALAPNEHNIGKKDVETLKQAIALFKQKAVADTLKATTDEVERAYRNEFLTLWTNGLIDGYKNLKLNVGVVALVAVALCGVALSKFGNAFTNTKTTA